VSYPAVFIGPRDIRKLREFLVRPSGSMSGEQLSADAVESGGLLIEMHPTWMQEKTRGDTAERLRYQALHSAYRALRDLGDDEGATLLNELANKEWSP
jgi:hypothetical protein